MYKISIFSIISTWICISILGILTFLLGWSWIWMILVYIIAIFLALSIFYFYRNRFVEHAQLFNVIKNLLDDDVDKSSKIIPFEIATQIRTYIIALFKEQYRYLSEKEKSEQPKQIPISHLTTGIECLLNDEQSQAEQLFGAEITNQIQHLLHNHIQKQREIDLNTNSNFDQLQGNLEQLIINLEKLVQSVHSSSRNAAKANKIAFAARDTASENQAVVESTTESIVAINQSSSKISSIVKGINAIAFQTNLLSLNASIEAARVGKAGAGFGVVAQEVRILSQKAADAAESSDDSVKEILTRVVSAESQVKQTTAAFVDLAEKTTSVGRIIETIQQDTTQQGHDFDSIHIRLMQLAASVKKEKRDDESSFGSLAPTLLLPKTYRIQTHWMAQAQFAGYYWAIEHGIYSDCGLKIELIDGGPEVNTLFNLIKGEIDFGTAWLSSALTTVSRGAELCLLSQIFQKSGLMLVALKKSGIKKIEDLKQRTVSSWGGFFEYPIMALDMDHSLDIHLVDEGVDHTRIASGELEAVAVMSYNELFSFIDAGFNMDDLITFKLADHGYNFPEDGLYANNKMINDEEVCRQFVQASNEGWRQAKLDSDSALDIVMSHHQRSTMQTDRAHQKRMLEEVLNLIGPADHTLGHLNREDYERTANALVRIGLIPHQIPYNHFYHNCQ